MASIAPLENTAEEPRRTRVTSFIAEAAPDSGTYMHFTTLLRILSDLTPSHKGRLSAMMTVKAVEEAAARRI